MRPLVSIVSFIQPALFRAPKDRTDITQLVDWSLGGITLSDGTQGLEIQNWKYTVEGTGGGTGIYLTSATNNYPHTLQLSAPNITWVRGTFDQNMHPAVSYVSGGANFLWWYDPITHVQEILPLDSTLISPTVVMDDTRERESTSGNNDIILAYLKSNALYFRLERDRYGVEYLWDTALPSYIEKPFINKMGMNNLWRFQLELGENPNP